MDLATEMTRTPVENIFSLVSSLPMRSRFMVKHTGVDWDKQLELLASIVDAINQNTLVAIGIATRKRPKRLKPYPRPKPKSAKRVSVLKQFVRGRF